MFHQSGGCCDGSAPMCYPAGEFRTGGSDVLLASLAVDGVPEPVEFWISKSQWQLWKHTRLTVDVVPGRGSGFSLEAPDGLRFLIRSTSPPPLTHPSPSRDLAVAAPEVPVSRELSGPLVQDRGWAGRGGEGGWVRGLGG